MKIIAIESSTVTASCAVAEDDVILGEYSLSHKQTHSEKLMPLIEKILEDIGIYIKDIEIIALSQGPGSYTGLRIGAAIAKSLSYACDIPIVCVPTLKSLAYNVYAPNAYIIPIMDAKAGRIYTGIYKWENEKLVTMKEQFPANIEDLIDILNETVGEIILTGDGSLNYREILDDRLKVKVNYAHKRFSILKSSSVACIGYEMAVDGCTVSASEAVPEYLRLSQAERNKKN